MIASHWVYRIWAQQYLWPLTGARFDLGMSFSAESLSLKFSLDDTVHYIDCKWVDGELVLSKGNGIKESSKNKKNALVQFKSLTGECVKSVSVMLLDRLVKLDFTNGMTLVFKGFGRFSNVILLDEDKTVLQVFRLNFKEDWNFTLIENDSRWWDLDNPISPDVLKEYLFKFKSIISKDDEFWNVFDIDKFVKSYSKLDLEFQKKDGKIDLVSYGDNLSPVSVFENINIIVNQLIKEYYFNNKHTSLKAGLTKKLQKLNSYIVGLQQQKLNLQERRSYKEIGDLIMSNAHSIKKGVSEALITDYFTGNRIRIKLNKDLSASQNAEKFYRKAKNESLELAAIEEKLTNTENLINKTSIELEKLNKVSSFSDFQMLNLPATEKSVSLEKQNQSTARKYTWHGIEFWVGKNAKSNDWILRNATKNDIWMHASGVAGSHGLIRNVSLSKLKNEDLEIAASITAYYSKGKNQSLQTVMYTERKFVSKIKGGNAGQVKVQKWESIDVEPKDFVKFIQS